MENFPDQVRNYIFNLCKQKCSIAYLKLDKEGTVCDLGGELQKYELSFLKQGQKIDNSIDYLSGFFPLIDNQLILEDIQINSDLFVDIHIFSTNSTDWIVWLDKTCGVQLKQQWQQKYNELNLLQVKYDNLYKESIQRKSQGSENNE
jgi:hypothetical protein